MTIAQKNGLLVGLTGVGIGCFWYLVVFFAAGGA